MTEDKTDSRTPAASERPALTVSPEIVVDLDNEVGELRQEVVRLTAQVENARAAIEPFSKMASAMYVSGHCGGASPEDWPGKWSISITGFDGNNFHMPSQHGGLLTVADFRKLSTALSSTMLGPEVKP